MTVRAMNSTHRLSIRMPIHVSVCLALILLSWRPVWSQEVPADHVQRAKQGTQLFQKTIRSALLEHCLACHGGEKTRGEFDLSSRERLLEGGQSGEVIDQEYPEDSYLMLLIAHDDEPSMPPQKDRLPQELIDAFQLWIKLGAPYDKPLIEKRDAEPKPMQVTDSDREFWSFRPLAKVAPPKVTGQWARTDIDRFVYKRLQDRGLAPNPAATDLARIRRLYLDVIGLPPTPDQVQHALSIPHQQLVDELLDSPHYGERWARHWLDAARFAESHGFEQDYDRKFAYHFRDFVIKALNQDMPWNQFVRWQIAGDELAPNDPLAMMATGFLGAGVFPTQLTEKEFESARYDELDDMAATIGTSMLGLTIGCARCHDHKYDPIPKEDYYRFISTFTTTIRSEIEIDLDPEGFAAKNDKWQSQHDRLIQARDSYRDSPEVKSGFDRWLASQAPVSIPLSPWSTLSDVNARSNQAATALTEQADGAILATGNTPAFETYTVDATRPGSAIRYLRIEALTHDSMPRKGPGRAGNGNFALSDFKLLAAEGDDEKLKPVKLASAQATHQQNTGTLSVESSFDGDPKGTGWAVDYGGIGKDQAAVFKLETPIESDGQVRLQWQLTFANNGQHSLGRFRLSVSSDQQPPVVVGQTQIDGLAEALAALERNQLTDQHRDTLFPYFIADDAKYSQLDQAVTKSLSQKPVPNQTKVQVSSEGFPPTKHHADGRGFPHFYPETYILNRGDPNQKEGLATTGYLKVLMRDDRKSSDWQVKPPADWTRTSYRRAGMANWMTDVDHGAGHLLARVAVNRLWHHHFGRGIVATPNDFGLQGGQPTHPELLDHLAQEFIDAGWKLKSIHRQILNSATWLQSVQPSADKAAVDPENQLLWRYPSRRVEAEIVRDTMLAVSGQLDTQMFGPGTLNTNHQRRSIYFMIKRSRLVPMMQIFDQPEPLSSQGSRPSTTIAPQALLFMNNAQVVKYANALAGSLPDQESEAAVKAIYQRALARLPSEQELQLGCQFIEAQAASYQNAGNRQQLALADFCQVIFGLNEFIYLP